MSRAPDDAYGLPASEAADYEDLRLDVIRRRWDSKARRWDADLADPRFHLNEDAAYERFFAAAEAAIAARAEFCRGHRLVDLGCGTGLVLARFAGRFAGSLGIDISPAMLAVAAGRGLPGAEFREANCFEFSRLVSGAGMVLSRGILLSHYGRGLAPRLWQEIHAALVPGGGVAMLDYLNASARGDYASNPDNKTYFHAAEMEAIALQAGFRQAATLGDPRRRVLVILAET